MTTTKMMEKMEKMSFIKDGLELGKNMGSAMFQTTKAEKETGRIKIRIMNKVFWMMACQTLP